MGVSSRKGEHFPLLHKNKAWLEVSSAVAPSRVLQRVGEKVGGTGDVVFGRLFVVGEEGEHPLVHPEGAAVTDEGDVVGSAEERVGPETPVRVTAT